MTLSAPIALSSALAAASLVMTLLWALAYRRTGKAGNVDVGWTFLTGGSVIWFALSAGGGGHRLLIAGAFAVWALRLGGQLLWHRCRPGMPDDGRYQRLRRDWGAAADRNMFWMYQAQALLAVLLAAAWLPAFHAVPVPLGAATWVTAGLLTLSLLGGAIADAQLARYRRRGPAGGICREGLWRHARHPNYFFEIVTWWLLAALALPLSPWPLAAAALMTWLITCVTGIPPKEKQALLTRGDAYRAYMAETRALLPWPRRQERGALPAPDSQVPKSKIQNPGV